MGRKAGTKGRRIKGAIGMSDDERFESDFSGSEASFPSSEMGFDYGLAAGGDEATTTTLAVSNFCESLEKLIKKRTSTREEGLNELITGLRSYAYVEETNANRETVITNIINLVKKAGATEGVLCAEALALVLLVLGPGEDKLFAQIVAPCEVNITRSSHEGVRIEAVRALAMGCFISCSEEEITVKKLRLMESIFSDTSEGLKASDELKAAAVDAWALLTTVAPQSYHTRGLRPRLLSTFLTLLDSPCPELKLAAGEALAFLNEYWRDTSEEFEYPEEEAEVMDAIIDKLQEFAKDGSKKMSRRDKKQQRKSFREVYVAVAENESPEEIISFRTRSFRLTTWAKLKQMEALRDCLQGGFLIHLQLNPVIHDIFQIPPGIFEGPQERSMVEKNSEKGKLRTNARARSRKNRENAKGAFLDTDGEDP